MPNHDLKRFYVLLLGPQGAGKSTLIANFENIKNLADLEQTIGMSYCFCNDDIRSVKGVFFDIGGDQRFSFITQEMLRMAKDCIVLLVDDLNIEKTLREISYYLEKIEESSENAEVPLGLIVNQKDMSQATAKILHDEIASRYGDRFQFVDHCPVSDPRFRSTLFNQLARVSGVQIPHVDPAVMSWGEWLMRPASQAYGAAFEGVQRASAHVLSLFKWSAYSKTGENVQTGCQKDGENGLKSS